MPATYPSTKSPKISFQDIVGDTFTAVLQVLAESWTSPTLAWLQRATQAPFSIQLP